MLDAHLHIRRRGAPRNRQKMMRIAAINDFRNRVRAENKLCARHLRSFNLRRRQNRSRASVISRKPLSCPKSPYPYSFVRKTTSASGIPARLKAAASFLAFSTLSSRVIGSTPSFSIFSAVFMVSLFVLRISAAHLAYANEYLEAAA